SAADGLARLSCRGGYDLAASTPRRTTTTGSCAASRLCSRSTTWAPPANRRSPALVTTSSTPADKDESEAYARLVTTTAERLRETRVKIDSALASVQADQGASPVLVAVVGEFAKKAEKAAHSDD